MRSGDGFVLLSNPAQLLGRTSSTLGVYAAPGPGEGRDRDVVWVVGLINQNQIPIPILPRPSQGPGACLDLVWVLWPVFEIMVFAWSGDGVVLFSNPAEDRRLWGSKRPYGKGFDTETF